MTAGGTTPLACPDWRALAAARDAQPGDPPGWDDALQHLAGCARCRRAAVEADPMLVFRRLPALPVAGDEIEAMRLRLAALRGAAEVTRPARRSWRSRSRHGLAAAAALVLMLFTGAQSGHPPAGELTAVAMIAPPSLAAELAAQPLIEELDQPFDNVVQWDSADLSVVLVLDERFASSAGG